MKTLADVIAWLEHAPDGTMVSARAMLSIVRDASPIATAAPAVQTASATWQERLWTVPPDTRMTVGDVCEALSRPKSWVYRHTSQASGLVLLPYRKLDGELVFVAGEVRDWIRMHEEIVVKPIRLPATSRPTLVGQVQ